MSYRAVGVSDVGRVRKVNEDTFVCMDDHRFFAVADGMGGHNAGEIASRLAVETMGSFISRSADGAEFSWPYGIEPTLSFEGNRLRTAIHLANRRVFRASEERDDYTGMGTTVVSALISDSTIIVGHVGDSRLYLWRNGALRQLTKDDSWAMTILAQELGEDRAALAAHPMKNVLTNVVGAREQTEIHVGEHGLSTGDVLLLCTDGLHGALEDSEIVRVLAEEGDLDRAAHALVQAALDGGSQDNVTVVLVHA
jgi:PPM family protein phosphatase